MKTPQDPRHKKRQEMIQALYTYSFSTKYPSILKSIINSLPELDDKIKTAAPDFPIDSMHKVDLAILRLSLFELLIDKKEPQKVIIDEAIELAKEFGGEHSPAFINGVLASVIKKKGK